MTPVHFNVDNPPALLSAADLAAVWGVSVGHIHKQIKRGAFDFLRPTSRDGEPISVGAKQFSGILLARYLKAEPLFVPTFGRRKAS